MIFRVPGEEYGRGVVNDPWLMEFVFSALGC